MLYNLPTLADKEWYRWGAEILVTSQNASGNFPDFYSDGKKTPYGEINTAFALLFLKRSHPMKDLTPKLPFTADELNKGIARLAPKIKGLDRTATSPGQSQTLERSTISPGQSRKPER
jgi:hypothetical protein